MSSSEASRSQPEPAGACAWQWVYSTWYQADPCVDITGYCAPPSLPDSQTERSCRAALKAAILRETRITRQHLTPEIPLRLITPECRLWAQAPSQTPTPAPWSCDPYWAFYWPGGQGLARSILDGRVRDAVRCARILDVGSGCGAGAIACVKMGAKHVLANDIDTNALIAADINADLNGVALDSSARDFIGSACEDFDTILIGDMFYDEDYANTLFEWLRVLAGQRKTVLIGDPGRHCLSEKRLEELELVVRYKLDDQTRLEHRGYLETAVWRLLPHAAINAPT